MKCCIKNEIPKNNFQEEVLVDCTYLSTFSVLNLIEDYRLKGCMNWENKKNNITGSYRLY